MNDQEPSAHQVGGLCFMTKKSPRFALPASGFFHHDSDNHSMKEIVFDLFPGLSKLGMALTPAGIAEARIEIDPFAFEGDLDPPMILEKVQVLLITATPSFGEFHSAFLEGLPQPFSLRSCIAKDLLEKPGCPAILGRPPLCSLRKYEGPFQQPLGA